MTKKTKINFALIMTMIMMAVSPAKMWADKIYPVTSNVNMLTNTVTATECEHSYNSDHVCTKCQQQDPSFYKDVLIGGKTDADISSNESSQLYPFYTNYRHFSQVTLYTKDQIGESGTIKSLAFYCKNRYSFATNSLKIYMKMVDASTTSLSTDFNAAEAGFTLVYSGNPTLASAIGWQTFTLDTPFEYDKTKNLLVAITRSSSSYSVNPGYAYTSPSVNTLIFSYSDTDTNIANLHTSYLKADKRQACMKLNILCEHKFSDKASDVAATCTEGSKSYYTVCGRLVLDGKTAASHNYSNGICTVCGDLAYDLNKDGSINVTDITLLIDAIKNGTTTPAMEIDGKEGINEGDIETLRNIVIEKNENNHEYVDLGLSVKWATMNVGASSPVEYGDYFAWGETEPYYTEGHSQDKSCNDWKTGKTGYDWASYKLCEGKEKTLTKYCQVSSYGNVDNKTVLEAVDDAATANWGSKWRMPTYEEQTELCNKCYWEWTDSYNESGIKGYIVYKKKSEGSYSLSDNHIFLPVAGYRKNADIDNVGSKGDYWSSSLYTAGCSDAGIVLYLTSSSKSPNYSSRTDGLVIRPVCK